MNYWLRFLMKEFHQLVYWACCVGVNAILLGKSVGLPPNLTGWIS